MGKKKGGGAGGAEAGKKKAERAFDFSKCSSRQVALQISYVGWDYKGFAAQVCALRMRQATAAAPRGAGPRG
jgi:hypothetical protein